jgi:hypothetical protein
MYEAAVRNNMPPPTFGKLLSSPQMEKAYPQLLNAEVRGTTFHDPNPLIHARPAESRVDRGAEFWIDFAALNKASPQERQRAALTALQKAAFSRSASEGDKGWNRNFRTSDSSGHYPYEFFRDQAPMLESVAAEIRAGKSRDEILAMAPMLRANRGALQHLLETMGPDKMVEVANYYRKAAQPMTFKEIELTQSRGEVPQDIDPTKGIPPALHESLKQARKTIGGAQAPDVAARIGVERQMDPSKRMQPPEPQLRRSLFNLRDYRRKGG